jgi:hypothetical protein
LKKHNFFGFLKSGGFDVEPFDPEKEYAVIRSSICTGEKTAGFKSKADGSFKEVMLIRSQKDLDEFKAKYNIKDIKTEY